MKRNFKTVRWMVATVPLLTGAVALAEKPMMAPKDTQQAQMKAPDAQMQKVLEAHKSLNPKPPHTVTPEVARKGPSAKDAVTKVLKEENKPTEPEKLGKVDDVKIPGAAGDLQARVYTPEGTGPFPVLVYFHGGGFVIADLDVYDATPRALAKQANAVVVSVHYRQAPEHPFPAAADDAVAAFRYVRQNAAKYNGDPQRVAVGGESAGGNLATVVAMREKKGESAPVFQLLVYPFVSNDLSTPSHVANGQGNYLVGNPDLAWFWQNYLGADWKKNKNAEALPIHATPAQLKGVAPAMVITAGLDPLKDEGAAYAKKLQAAGVKTELKNYEGVTHEFFGMAAVVDTAKTAQADAVAALKRAFEKTPSMGGTGEPMTRPTPKPMPTLMK